MFIRNLIIATAILALPAAATASSVQEDAAAAERIVRKVQQTIVFHDAFEHLKAPARPKTDVPVETLFDQAFTPRVKEEVTRWIGSDGVEHLHGKGWSLHFDIDGRPIPNYSAE